MLGAGGSGGSGGGAGYDMSSSNFGATILGEATNKAVTEVAMKLDESAAKLPTVVIAVDGLVADVSGNSLILNVGKHSGLKTGDILKGGRTGRESQRSPRRARFCAASTRIWARSLSPQWTTTLQKEPMKARQA